MELFGEVFNGMGNSRIAQDTMDKETQYSNTVIELKKEWNKNYKANLNQYKQMVDKLGITEKAREKGWNNDLDFIRMIHSISDDLGETSVDDTTGSGTTVSFNDHIADIDKQFTAGKITREVYNEERAKAYKHRNEVTGRQPTIK